jgi:hypothetical protein
MTGPQLNELPPTIELLQFALQFKEIDVRSAERRHPERSAASGSGGTESKDAGAVTA